MAFVGNLVLGGDTIEEAFEQVAIAMFGYMTDNLKNVEIDESKQATIEVEGIFYFFYSSTRSRYAKLII